MITSGCTGWAPNAARMFKAKNIYGPWEQLPNPCRDVSPAVDPFAPVAYQGPNSVHGWGDITEGFTMQYTWTVPHDVRCIV